MKYKITDETIKYLGKILHRIEALYTFDDVKIGNKGGFIESENNLSQEGTCWIYNNAKVLEKAVVSGDARIYDNAVIRGNALIYDNAEVTIRAAVRGNAKIYGNAYINGNVIITDEAQVYDNASIKDNAIIRGNAKVYGHAEIYGNSYIRDYVEIYENAIIKDWSHIYGKAKVSNYAVIFGNAQIKDVTIREISDYIVFKNWWSSGRYFTWTRSNNMWNVGCFYGTGEELIAKAYKDSESSGREYERIVKYVESILIGNNESIK